jgi:hypothetical protein
MKASLAEGSSPGTWFPGLLGIDGNGILLETPPGFTTFSSSIVTS